MKQVSFIPLFLFLVVGVQPAKSFSKKGTTYFTDGSQADVVAAIAAAAAGDTVQIPEGTFTWGASRSSVSVSKPIILEGASRERSIIKLSDTGPTYGSGTIGISGAGMVRRLSIQAAESALATAFSCGGVAGWRITEITYVGGTAGAYFAYCATYGLIDNCDITGNVGNAELIFVRGPTNSWQTPHSMGTVNAVFIEDCIFRGHGYVCDFNSNSRGVVRYNTITGNMRIDGHGLASNTPPRGVRHLEIYGNIWTDPGKFWAAIEIRGGTGRIFDNKSVAVDRGPDFFLTEYGAIIKWPNFNNQYQTPSMYPAIDQIGVGMDPKRAGSEPYYLWNNIKGGGIWALVQKAIPQEAIDQYGVSFTMEDIVKANRDYFMSVDRFDGSSGVGMGSAVQMRAITPTLSGVGFWVTDEGEWNRKNDGPDGRFYVWNGSSWVVNYMPYMYPHPLQQAAPPSTIPAAPSNLSMRVN